jgi:hypothetical protein
MFVSSGDTGVNKAMAALTGFVPGDPCATERNQQAGHAEIAGRSLFVADRAGNGCNFSQSALGAYAMDLTRLRTAADLQVVQHRPMALEILNERGDVRHTDLVATCVGMNVSADIATALDVKKTHLKQLRPRQRLAQETLITARAALQAKPVKTTVTWNPGSAAETETLETAAGVELICTPVYAKEGRARLAMGTVERQLVTPRRPGTLAGRLGMVAATGVRLKTGRYPRRPILFSTNSSLSIRLDTGNPESVGYHVDGELGPAGDRYQLYPGETMRITLGRVAVPVLVRR